MSAAEDEARRIVRTDPKEILSTPAWHALTRALLDIIDDERLDARMRADFDWDSPA